MTRNPPLNLPLTPHLTPLACPLCESNSSSVYYESPQSKTYYHCNGCDLRFLHPDHRLNAEDEKVRYQSHNNSESNPHFDDYLNFLNPIINLIQQNHFQSSIGLDFGSGPNPVLANRLRTLGYRMNTYDPYFSTDRSVLNQKYQFITCTEVAEHFYHPRYEFETLKTLLNSGGCIAIMTHLYTPKIDFKNWYYLRDQTHVVFYSEKTFNWIKSALKFQKAQIISDRLVLLRME
jgi:hypothetical protein